MNPLRKTRFVALLLLAGIHSSSVHAANWQVFDIGSLGGGSSTAVALNNSGQVTGTSLLPTGPDAPFVTGPNGVGLRSLDRIYGPFVYDPDNHHGYGFSTPIGINNAGQVTGTGAVNANDPLPYHAFISAPSGGAITDLAPPNGNQYSSATGINNSGQVVGAYISDSVGRAFITDANGSGIRDIGGFDPNYDSSASAINDSGQVVISGRLSTGQTGTFLTGANGTGIATTVGSIGTGPIFISGLNNSAQIIGGYGLGTEARAFMTGAGGTDLFDLGTLGGATYASGLNNNGLVVGQSAGNAFIYGLNGGGMINLNSLVTLRVGEYLTSAADINDLGQIVANSNLGRAYLISPVPEPAAYMMLLAGLGIIGRRIYKSSTVSRETS